MSITSKLILSACLLLPLSATTHAENHESLIDGAKKEGALVLNTYLHNVEDAKRKGAPVDWLAQDPVFTKFQPIAVGAKAPHPNSAKLFVNFMLSEEGQKIIASFGRMPTRRGLTSIVKDADKLNYVVDEIGAADDYNKNYEQFRKIFGVPNA